MTSGDEEQTGTGFEGVWAQARTRPILALIIVCLCLFLPGIATLPPLDRDEARFAQATKQMIETGDYVEIRFQDQARNKKPVGIYWMQVPSAALFSGPNHNHIWAYRIPSVIGAILAVLGTFAIGSRLFGPQAGLFAGLLMASTVLLIVESTIAKTDAVLCATAVWAMWGLLAAYQSRSGQEHPLFTERLVFWVALGLGILVKGPVVPMIVGLTAITLCITERDLKWLWRLSPLWGVPVLLAIVLPWGFAIWSATGGAFFTDAVGGDFAPKLFSGQESHGAPPGYYLLLVTFTLWPASLFLWPAIARGWKRLSEPAYRFLAAWILPSWIVFELVPTKLPHYPLPLYPALVLLIAGAVMAWSPEQPTTNRTTARIGTVIWLLGALVFASLFVILPILYEGGASVPMVLIGVAILALSAQIARSASQHDYQRLTLILPVLAFLTFMPLMEGLARHIPDMRLSEQLAEALETEVTRSPNLVSVGYSEPSLVFLTGTDTQLLNPTKAVAWLQGGPSATALVESSKIEEFEKLAAKLNLKLEERGQVDGFSYSRGRRASMTLYSVTSPQDKAPGDLQIHE